MHCTAAGKVLLAHADGTEDGRWSDCPLPALTPHTINDRRVLRAELLGIRKDGLAYAYQEYVRGLVCVAAPVIGQDGEVLAALAVGDDSGRFAADHVAREVRRASVALSALLHRAGIKRSAELS